MQMQAAGVLVAEAEFPGAGDFMFDGEIALLRVAILELGGNGQGERENGKRETRGQIILVGKKRTGSERIEALLTREIEHVGQRVQNALENRGTVEIGGRIESAAARGVARRGGCRGKES